MRGLLVLLAFFSFSSFGASPQVIKTLDGFVATCDSNDDVIKHRNSGSAALVVEQMIVQDETITLKIRVDFLSCQKGPEGFAFKKLTDPNTLSYSLLERQITVERKDFNLSAIASDYAVLDEDRVPSTRGDLVQLSFSKGQASRSLNGKAYIDLILTGLSRNSDNLGNASAFEPISFGTFRLFF